MPNPTPGLTPEEEKEFDSKFKCIQDDCAGGGHTYPNESESEGGQCQFCAEYIYPIKSFIASLAHSREVQAYEIARKEMIKEGERLRSRYGKRKSMDWGERNLVFGVIDEYQKKIAHLSRLKQTD